MTTPEKTRKKIVEQHAKGQTIEEIAEQLGLPRSTVGDIVARRGATRRGTSSGGQRRAAPVKERRERPRALPDTPDLEDTEALVLRQREFLERHSVALKEEADDALRKREWRSYKIIMSAQREVENEAAELRPPPPPKELGDVARKKERDELLAKIEAMVSEGQLQILEDHGSSI